jgi:hypothetical protein
MENSPSAIKSFGIFQIPDFFAKEHAIFFAIVLPVPFFGNSGIIICELFPAISFFAQILIPLHFKSFDFEKHAALK